MQWGNECDCSLGDIYAEPEEMIDWHYFKFNGKP